MDEHGEPLNELVHRFAGSYSFALDDFQLKAADALAEGRSALVCAPTGAGKTVVGEFGVWLALQKGGKAFYTTPLKALSNQKFGDFIARHGADNVGLLTGDNAINGEAPIVVMTTEVLRNMLYERSPTLRGLTVVVMDEVHYLRDPYRGATWEEVLIHLAPGVQVAALSATVSNAQEFGGWLRSVRGETDVIVEERRPVPIEHVYMVGKKLHPMFVRDGDRLNPNPVLRRLNKPEPRHRRGPRHRHQGPPEGHKRVFRPDRIQVAERLAEERMLPAIVFIFSRAGCDQAVEMCVNAHLRLTTPDERERIREYVELRARVLPDEDLDVLGYDRWLAGLEDGIAAHHAGLIPLFKETVEELFERALCKVVFATETLSLGINMPAKTVVIERLTKWTGERHEMLTPADFTQLTGRAGRRGMDDVGYGITLFQNDIPFERIAQLAEARSYQLVSSFRPSYNMAVNLLRTHTVQEAGRLLNLSFGQYLADRGVVKQSKQIARNEAAIEGYRANIVCDRGDFEEYWALARQVRSSEKELSDRFRRDRARNVRASLDRLKPGQVVRVRRGARRGLVAVIEVRHGKSGDPQALVITQDAKVTRLAVRDFREEPQVVGEVTIPRGDPRAPRVRQQVASQLDDVTVTDGPPPELFTVPAAEHVRALTEHPSHDCPERYEHERWMRHLETLEADTAKLRKRVRARTQTLARTFERVLSVLESLRYISGEDLTPKGEQLSRIYNESDLLVAEAIAIGVFDDLDPAQLAAVVSTLVFETRIGEPLAAYPDSTVKGSFEELRSLFRTIRNAEQDQGLELVREPDPGFMLQIHAWASGAQLEDVLLMGEMTPGDFVRSTKQIWDLLRQLADVSLSEDLASRAREAARAVYRGVVASSGTL